MHNPTDRVLRILDIISRSPGGLTLAAMSRELDIPKTTLLPILQTLCQSRYLSRSDGGEYAAGTALFSLASAFSGSFPVLEYVRSQLTELVEAFGETCYCGTLVDGLVLYLDKVDSPQPLRVLTSTGKRLPAYATSIGKALLSDHSQEDLRSLYPDGLKALTENTITDISQLSRQLSQARLEGYAWEIEESTEHIRCFACPIRKHGKIVAAVSVAIPLFRYQQERKEQIVSVLKQRAEQMGAMFEKTDAHFGELF